jgi:hypothetical protein
MAPGAGEFDRPRAGLGIMRSESVRVPVQASLEANTTSLGYSTLWSAHGELTLDENFIRVSRKTFTEAADFFQARDQRLFSKPSSTIRSDPPPCDTGGLQATGSEPLWLGRTDNKQSVIFEGRPATPASCYKKVTDHLPQQMTPNVRRLVPIRKEE